jgi:sulfate/thiosulfate-binding protein
MQKLRLIGAVAALSLLAAACASSEAGGEGAAAGECEPPETPSLTLAAYSTPREVYGKIIPAFRDKWKEEHNGQTVIFQESYDGSTSQAQNVVNGFDADIVALSLGPDVDQIVDAGLITHDWSDAPDGGMVSTSVAVFDVRSGNPDEITDFDDLAKPGIEVLTPDPVSSGGARWNLVAAYGAAMRGHTGNEADDEAGARQLIEGILGNVIVFDKTARDSIKNFEAGNGDVAITYENEILTAQAGGLDDEMVIPPSTVLIENPVAIVDEYVDEHCVRPVAEAFLEFLHSDEAKELYTDVGHLRSTDLKIAQWGDGDQFAPIEDLWTVDELGGWDFFTSQFEDGGLFTQALEKAQG